MHKLMQNQVHYGCVDEFAMHALTMAYMLKQYSVPKLMFDFKADSTTWTFPAMHTAYLKQVEYREELLDVVKFSPSGSHLREEAPYGILEEAKKGTLKLGTDTDPNFKDPKTLATPLMYAAAYGQTKLVKELLEHQASVNAETWNNCTALTFAAENASGRAGQECMKLLIAAKADATHQAGWQTEGVRFFQTAYGRGEPLGMQIALKSEFEKLDLLLGAGYSVNQHNTRGQTPMWKACWRCDLPFIQRLLDAKSEFVESKPLNDPKCFIPKCQHMQIQSYFHNWTCAHNALASPQIGDVLSCFLENKLDPNMTSRVPGIPFPVSFLLWSAILSYGIYDADDVSICERLLHAKADINMWSSKALNLRMGTLAALFVFNTAGVQFFLDNGADVNAKAWGLGNFVEAATKVKNKVAVDTYRDWLLMQSSKEDDKEILVSP
jgi:ankyrin repeat protein